jgi:acyl carrier protein
MVDSDIRTRVHAALMPRLQRLGLGAADLTDDLDLVRSGVLDSLGFVDLIAGLEDSTGLRVDLEAALGAAEATTVGGVINLFSRS